MLDFLIVGAGIFGATFARIMTDQGAKCLVVEKRDYIGGNCADEEVDGIRRNLHGGHIFHTNDSAIWYFVNRFADFWQYRHKVMAYYRGQMYSLPINMLTLNQLFGVTSPAQAREQLMGYRASANGDRGNLEAYARSQVGPEVYETLFAGYTAKQWGRPASELPASIIKRIPIRYTWDSDYFSDTYQGMPRQGYSNMITNMLEGIEVKTGIDWLQHRDAWEARHTVYTGPVDELFDCDLGALEYRSLRWEHGCYAGDYQGIATVNYTDADVPFTRVLEWKHYMEHPPRRFTLVSREYPEEWQPGRERYYPIPDAKNNRLAAEYKQRAKEQDIILGGRLATYRYIDMHQAVAAAMKLTERFS